MKQINAKSPTKIKKELGNVVQKIRNVQKFLEEKSNDSVDDSYAHREKI